MSCSMKKYMRRFIVYCLVVCMILSICPMSYADASDGDEDVMYTSEAELAAHVEELESRAESSGTEYEGYIFKLKDSAAMLMTFEDGEDSSIESLAFTDNAYMADSVDEILEYFSAGDIEYIEPNYIMTLFDADTMSVTEPNDQYYQNGYQWNLDVLNVPTAWEYGLEGTPIGEGGRVVVAVIDSGINAAHEDIDAGHILDGYSYVTSDTSDTSDTLGHGTFCIGQIMATKDNEVGIAGIAPEVYIMPLRVFGSTNSAYTSDIVSAINYAVQSGEVDVISMSLGGEGTSTLLQDACQAAVDAGILVVAAAGNDGSYTLNYPAAYDCVIGVGSVGTDSGSTEVSEFSQLGTTNVFCTAPGYQIVSTYYTSAAAYYRGSGTSFAAPEVAALGAILKSIDRSIDQEAFMEILTDTCTDLGADGRDEYYGYGLVDFRAAIQSVVNTDGEDGTVTIQVVNEDGAPVEDAVIEIYDGGTGTLIEAQEDGSYILPSGSYRYVVTADKYETATGVFTVISAGRVVRVTLEGLSYPYGISPVNTAGDLLTDAVITIKNSKNATMTAESFGSYSLKTGTYTYSITATGYYTQTGSFTVEEGGGSLDVTMYGDIDVASARIRTVDGDGDAVSGVTVSIFDSGGGRITQYTDGYYKLYPGAYTYTAESTSYKTETGSFTITDEQKGTIIELTVEMLNPIVWVYFEVVPIFAEITVYDGSGSVAEPYAPGEYKLLKGDYTYQATADGYLTVTDSFTITTSGMTVEIEMEKGNDSGYSTVTYISNGGTAVNSVRARTGGKLTEPEEPERTGYAFAGWYKEAALSTPWNFDVDVVTGNISLYAKWLPAEYNIIYIFGDSVLDGLAPSTHTYGTTMREFPVPALEGYHFMYWCSDPELTTPVTYISALKASDVVLYACCEEDTGEYTVSFETNGGTAVEPVVISGVSGYKVSEPETEPVKPGYTFSGWYADEELTTAWDFNNGIVSWHMTLYAKWTANTYKITYFSNGTELTGLTPSSYTYNAAAASLPVPEGDGVFAGWYSDEAFSVRVRSIPLGSAGDITLYAKWADIATAVPEDCDYEPDENGNYPAMDDEGYTLIYTQEQLAALSAYCNTAQEALELMESGDIPKFRLAQSIMLTGEWTPIGVSGYFVGELDGAGHTIAGLNIASASTDASLMGKTYGATVSNLILYGAISGSSRVSSVAGETYYSDFINIESHVELTASGTSVGGIISSTSGGSIINCVNYGSITCNGSVANGTAVYAVGGILGNMAPFTSSAATVSGCVNYGDIVNNSGTPTGGIVGYTNNDYAAVTNCYNRGDVTQTNTASAANCGTAAGIVGWSGGKGEISGCYSTGTISSAKVSSNGYNLAAGITFYVGSAGGSQTSVNVSNCFYLDGTTVCGDLAYKAIGEVYVDGSIQGYVWYYYDYHDDTDSCGSFAYAAAGGYSGLTELLGEAYTADSQGTLNSGYPVLAWQASDTFAVRFEVLDAVTGEAVTDYTAALDGEAVDGGGVNAAQGLHRFTVAREGYQTQAGLIYIGANGARVSVALEPVYYSCVISISPPDAELLLTNAKLGTIAPKRIDAADGAAVYTYYLASGELYGDYSYAAEKYGYESAAGSFDLSGDRYEDIAMKPSVMYGVYFQITPDGAEASVTVTDAKGNVISPDGETERSYQLSAGAYSYAVKAEGYYTVSGSFDVPDDNVTTVMIDLTGNTGWNGTSDTDWYDAGEEIYYLSTAEELAGFRDLCNAGNTFEGKTIVLTGDIDLKDRSWTPVGKYSYSGDTDFRGTFDGGGHTINGLNASGTMRVGLFSSVYNAVIKNLTVEGKVSGTTYIGGFSGYARGSTFENCTSNVDVTTSHYQAGGIAGSAATIACTFIRCINNGTITAAGSYTGTNSYAIGGIVGAMSYTGTIEYCRNNGTIIGNVQSVGGIAGYVGTTSGTVYPVIANCYNTGSVSSAAANGYAGGIIGDVYGTYNYAEISNCLNIGEVSSAGVTYAGGIVGYKGSTKAALSNCWYLSAQTSTGIGGAADVSGQTDPCLEENYTSVVNELGEAFTMKDDQPALSWQVSVSKYTVTFHVSYDTQDNLSGEYAPVFTVTRRGSDGLEEMFEVGGSGTVKLENGTYEYTVSLTGYEPVTGSFSVSSETMTVPVTLTAKTYTLGIMYTPSGIDADVVLKDSAGTEFIPISNADGLAAFEVTNGTYTYTISAYGYEIFTGSVGVSFSSITVIGQLTRLDAYDVTFFVTSESGVFTDVPTVVVYHSGSVIETVNAGETVSLASGSYAYTARAAGYETSKGEFSVEESGSVIITLALRDPNSTSSDTGWYTDHPEDTEFTISNAEELWGLAELVNNGIESFEGKTVNIADDIDLGSGGWIPIGSWSGGHFSGTLNGQGHSVIIRNGELSGSEICFGLFGYLDGATVENLILRGAISIAHGSDSTEATVVYVGALSGYASGSTIKNVANQMNVTVRANIGSSGVLDVGGLIGWASGSSLDSCNNIGEITAALTTLGINGSTALSYAGGIVGYGLSGTETPLSITNCYNTGAVKAQAPSFANAAGVIGTLNSYGSVFQMRNCYSAGAVTAEGEGSTSTAAICTSTSISGVTANNYYLDTLSSAIGFSKTKLELQSEDMVALLGSAYAYAPDNYPVFTWEKIVAAVEVNTMPDKTVYNDMEDFEDAGLTLTVTYTDGSRETVTSGWAVPDGDDLRVNKDGAVDTSSAEVHVTVDFRGVSTAVPVTVKQTVHEITGSDLALDIPAPKTGESAEPIIIETDMYTAAVTWTKAGEEVTGGVFEDNAFYRADVEIEAKYQTGEVWYAFNTGAFPTANGSLQTLYKLLFAEAANDGNRTRMTAVFTYPATGTHGDTITQTALHLYYEGDDRASADYSTLLDKSAVTISDGAGSVRYTLRELETMLLAGMGTEADYSSYNGAYRTNTRLTGLSLYDLCRDSGLFADNLDDSSVVTVGGTELTWGQIRATGGSYDTEGNLIQDGLPALLAVAAAGTPYTVAAGPLKVMLPMQSPNGTLDIVEKVSTVTLTRAGYLEQCRISFSISAADGEDISDRLETTVADTYGNVIAPQADGSYLLNRNQSYSYVIAAEGFGTLRGRTGAVTGDMTITLSLDRIWDGKTLNEPETGEDGYYLIFTAEELMWFNAHASADSNARLMADITLNSDGEYVNLWQPMFYSETRTGSYGGTFDGNGHTIKNLYISLENEYEIIVDWSGAPMLMSDRWDTLGLFGYLSGTVKDLAVTGRIEVLDRPASELADWFQLGGIAGFLTGGGLISGCSTDIDIVYTVSDETGVTGAYPDRGFPESCDVYVGGIVGSISNGTVENCYSAGSICAGGTRSVSAGGIAGGLRSSSTAVLYCYSTSDITAFPGELYSSYMTTALGSIVGCAMSVSGTESGRIEYCFGLAGILDGVNGERSYANRIVGVGGNTATLSYNYGNQAMSIVNVTEHNDTDYSRGSVNGANITLSRAMASLLPYTNIGWSASVWKSDSADSLPTFLWQQGSESVVTYTVTVDAENAELSFTGGVADGKTTSTSTVSFTVAASAYYRVASVTCTGGTLSGAGGYYTISNITGDVTITVTTVLNYGDVDKDGRINAVDAMLILRYGAGLYDLTDEQLTAADVNGDGIVNSSDAITILHYSIGRITIFPVMEPAG